MSLSEFFVKRSKRQDYRLRQLEQMDSSPVVARATHEASQNIANNTYVPIVTSVVSYDSRNALDVASNFQYTAPLPGFYRVTCGFFLNASALFNGTTESIGFYSVINSSVEKVIGGITPRTSVSEFILGVDTIELDIGDLLQVACFHNAGGTVSLYGTSGSTQFNGHIVVERLRGYS